MSVNFHENKFEYLEYQEYSYIVICGCYKAFNIIAKLSQESQSIHSHTQIQAYS